MNNNSLYYLKEDIYFEPLNNHWYAYPYVLAPATAARHMVHTHRRLMNSFVKNYKLHIIGASQAGTAGSEFLDCDESQISEIKLLVEQIDTEHGQIVAFSAAIDDLNKLLKAHVSGESIEHLYQQIPVPLQGLVELTMDLDHNPGYRFFESLLYKSEFYKPSMQSLRFGSLEKVAQRPFVLSTPRLADDDHLHIAVDFNDDIMDTLSRARLEPLSGGTIKALFEGYPLRGGLAVEALFTEHPPQSTHQPVTEGIRFSYIGHAGFLLETAEVAILIDPVIASRDDANGKGILSFSDLPPKIDYLCITHGHLDHANIESLLQLRHKTDKVLLPRNNGGSLADPSLKLMLKTLNFNVLEMDDMDVLDIAGGQLISIPFLGEHGDLNVRSKTAWHFKLLGKSIFVGADSSNLDPNMYQRIYQQIKPVDIMAIGMECVGAPYTWIYGALYSRTVGRKIRESRRLNGSGFEQAINIVNVFKPDEVYLYALGLEPWYRYFMGIEYDENSEQLKQTSQMVAECTTRGLVVEKLYGQKVMQYSR